MEKEIMVKAISKKDTKSGPMISLMDGESVWYSVFKNTVKDDTWDQLSLLKQGDMADITWMTTVSRANGQSYNNLTGFTKVLRSDEDVKPGSQSWPPYGADAHVQSRVPGLPRETPPATDKDTLISKQVCLKGGVEMVVAIIHAVDRIPDAEIIGNVVTDPAGQAMIYAKRLYGILRENW